MTRRATVDYARIASVYDQAVRAGSRAPTSAVAREFGLSISTAGKHVMRARERGLLPPTVRGSWRSNNPHRPATAVVARRSRDQRTWDACVSCLLPWPCPTAQAAKSVT